MSVSDSGYTIGEISGLVAPLFGRNPEELQEFVFIANFSCPDSPIESHLSVISSLPDDLTIFCFLVDLLSEGLSAMADGAQL